MSEQQDIIDTTAEPVTENGSTPVNEVQPQAQNTFTQEDVDRIVQTRLKQVERKYANVDIDEYAQLQQQQEAAANASLMKKEQFETLLTKQKDEYSSKINQLQTNLENIQIDGALISSASKQKALNPDHIGKLLRDQVRLNSDSTVEVLDKDGQVRYNTETAELITIDEVVNDFLNANPYFMSAAPSGSGSNSNTSSSSKKETKLNDLDMTNPADRAIYKQHFAVGSNRSFKS